METCTRREGDRLLLDLKVVPGASRTEIVGIKERRVRVRVAAAPEGGKANAELRAFLAKALGCAKSAVMLVSGEKSRLKTLSVPAATAQALRELIGE
jgi:uncharacterized protein (TIGR00251 family)